LYFIFDRLFDNEGLCSDEIFQTGGEVFTRQGVKQGKNHQKGYEKDSQKG
jgi:hypothetical protein